MATSSKRWIGLAGVIATLLLTVGCASTRVNFVGPPGTVLFVDGKPHHLPVMIEMGRPAGNGQTQRHEVSLVATVQSKELRAKGHIDLFGYTESDVDRLAVNTCNLEAAELAKIFDGTVVIFRAQSSSRQPLYDLTLAKE